jgi:DHA3 family macrolide efflux protein-like MFS transporter
MKKNSGLLSLLKYREFMKLWAGGLVSRIGDSIDTIAFMWLVYQLTGSGLMMGTILAVNFLPNLLFGMIAGVFVDRWPKKTVLFCTNIGRGLLVTVTALLLYFGVVQIWHLYVLTFLMSTLETLESPARLAVVPHLITDKSDMMAASGLGQASSSLAAIVGLALGGAIVGLWGVPVALIVDAATFFFYAACVTLTSIPRILAKSAAGIAAFWEDFKGGIKIAFGNGVLRVAIIMGLFLNFFVTPFNVIAPLYADRIIHAGAGGYAAMETVITIAMMVGALLIGQFGKKLKYRLIVVGGVVLVGVAFILMGVLPHLMIAAIGAALLGLGAGFLNSTIGAMFMTHCPPEYLGRLGSVAGSLMMAATPAASALAGTFADLFSLTGIFIGIGILVLVTAIIVNLSPSLRNASIEVKEEPQAVEAE